MKKILYSVFAIATLGIATSCSEDKGTSFETADANQNEYVDPNDIRAYDRPGTAGESIAGIENRATADEQTAEQLVRAYYTEPNRPGSLNEELRFNETTRMGGLDTDTTKATSPKASFGGSRPAGPGKQRATLRPAADGSSTTPSGAVRQGNFAQPETMQQTTKKQTAKPAKKQELKKKN